MSDVSDLFDITVDLINIANNPGFDAGAGYAVPEIYDNVISGFETLRNGLTDIEDLFTALNNEATARVNTDTTILEYIDLLSQRISNLIQDPIPQTSSLDGSRVYVSDFFEVFTEDQIDGLTQRLSLFTNALSTKLTDISSLSDAGLTFDKSNPSIPVITANRPLWNEVRNKPSTFPPNTHGHAIADTVGLQTALDGRILLSEKGSVSGVASLDGAGKIPASQLPVYEPALQIVNTIAQRNALTPTVNLPVYVKDATGDPTVTTGGAFYLYELATLTWIKLSEMESMEIVQSWANVTGKPTVFTADLSTLLTGLSVATGGNVTATDSILVAFGRIQNFINNIFNSVRSTVLTGLSTATGGAVTATDTVLQGFGKIQNVLNNIATTIRATVLTGLVTTTGGVITATDTLLVALGKLQNQITNAVTTAEKTLWNNTTLNAGNITGSVSFSGFNLNRTYKATLTGNTTFSAISGGTEGNVYVMVFTQDATGGRTISLPANVLIPSGETPDTGANKTSILTMYFNGTNYLSSWKKGW